MNGALIGALRVTLGLDSAAFEKGANDIEKRSRKLERSIGKFGKGLTAWGQKLTLGVTVPLAAFGATAIKAAMESRDAMGQVDAALGSMGDAAGRTRDQLAGLATGLMKNSLYDDDEILRSVTANLLTFGKIAGREFDRAQQAAVDLATRMKMDLQSATLLVGKALNDPVKGMGALRKAGIQLSEAQQQQVKDMVALGDAAGAQRVLLAELENQFRGSARAAREANPFAAAKMSWAEFQETVGEKLLPLLPALTDALTRLLDAFSAMPDGMQSTVILLGGIAAAAGPVLMGLGALTSTFSAFLAIVGTAAGEGGLLVAAQAAFAGLAAVLGPVLVPLAALAAVGAVIYANWDKIAPVLSEAWEAIKQALGPEVQAMVAEISAGLAELWSGPQIQFLRAMISGMVDFSLAMSRALGPPVLAMVKILLQGLTNFFSVVREGGKVVGAMFRGDFSGALQHVMALVNKLFGGMPAYVAGKMAALVTAVKTWVVDKLGAVWELVSEKIEKVKKAFFHLYDAVVGHSYIPDMVEGIARSMDLLDAVMVEPAEKATSKAKKAFRQLAEDVRALLGDLYPEADQLRAFERGVETIQRAVKGKLLTAAEASDAASRLAEKYADVIRPFGTPQALDAHAEQLKKKLVDPAAVAADEVKRSFDEMASATLDAFDRMAGAIKGGGFLDILSSVLGMLLQLKDIGAIGAIFGGGAKLKDVGGKKMPAYAGGTSFHPGGLALVGERGPEVVNLPRGSSVFPNGSGPAATNIHVTPSPYFDVVVDGRVMRAAPGIAEAGGRVGMARARQAGEWALR